MKEKMPDLAAAGETEQMEFAFARFADKEVQLPANCDGVIARSQPFLLGHGVTPFPEEGPRPNNPVHAAQAPGNGQECLRRGIRFPPMRRPRSTSGRRCGR